jgi:hypothetical protein
VENLEGNAGKRQQRLFAEKMDPQKDMTTSFLPDPFLEIFT